MKILSEIPVTTCPILGDGYHTMSMDMVSRGGRSYDQATVGPNLNMGSSVDTGDTKVTQSFDGKKNYLQQNQSNLVENYRGSAMESSVANQAYNKQASRMQGLNVRSGELASKEHTQMQSFAERWMNNTDVSSSVNERLANSMAIVASGGITSSDTFGDKSSKGTDTEAHLRGNIGGAVIKALGADIGSGTSARNSDYVTMDKSASETQSYSEALNNVRDYAKSHDIREGVGISESASSDLQDTWREQEMVASDKSITSQSMASINSQLSHINQHQASIDTNWNDKILDEVASRHNFATKEEALHHLDGNRQEGQQVLQELVAKQYGTEIQDTVARQGASLTSSVERVVPSHIDYESTKSNLHSAHVTATDNNEAVENLQNDVNTKVQIANSQAQQNPANQSIQEFNYTMNQRELPVSMAC